MGYAEWVSTMEEPERQELYKALIPHQRRPAGPSTLDEVSSVFGRLSAKDKRFFITEIYEGAKLGAELAAESDVDAAWASANADAKARKEQAA